MISNLKIYNEIPMSKYSCEKKNPTKLFEHSKNTMIYTKTEKIYNFE